MLGRTCHRKTWKEFGKRVDPHKTWTQCWPGEGVGPYTKRLLSKARRRSAQEFINEYLYDTKPHLRSLDGKEREANWKTW